MTTKTRFTKKTPSIIKTLAAMKLENFSAEMFLILDIVNENASARYPMLYIGEVHAVFHSALPVEAREIWSYSAVSSMLRKLDRLGYLTMQKDGRFNQYGITDEGVALLVKILGPKAEKSPKKSAAARCLILKHAATPNSAAIH